MKRSKHTIYFSDDEWNELEEYAGEKWHVSQFVRWAALAEARRQTSRKRRKIASLPVGNAIGGDK